jgi:hypothetical protein
MLQEVTQSRLCKSLIFFMLHLLQMLQGKSSHFLRKKKFFPQKNCLTLLSGKAVGSVQQQSVK